MSIESAKAFIERMKTDEEFAKQAGKAKDAMERMEFAANQGYDFTNEEIKEAAAYLTDGELDSVSGGLGCRFNQFF